MRVMAGLVTIATAVTDEPEKTVPVTPASPAVVKPSTPGRGRHRLDAFRRRMSQRKGTV
jgi:hypothetical protein